MSQKFTKRILTANLYQYELNPLSAGQTFFTDDGIFYEDIQFDERIIRCAISKTIKFNNEDILDSQSLKNTYAILFDGSEYRLYYYNENGNANLISGSGGGGWVPPATTRNYQLLQYNQSVSAWQATNELLSIDAITFNEYTNDNPANQPPLASHKLRFTTADKTLSLQVNGVDLQLGQEIYMYMKNTSSSNIQDGNVIKATGGIGNSEHLSCGLYQPGDPYYSIVGVATEDIPINGWGFVTVFGVVRNINLSYISDLMVGDILYANENTAGLFQKTIPSGGYRTKNRIAMVIRTTGQTSIFVRPTFVPSIFDLQGVKSNSFGGVNGEFLVYDEDTNEFVADNIQSYLKHSTAQWVIINSTTDFKIQQVGAPNTDIITIYGTGSGGDPNYKIKINGKTEITDLDFGGW